MPQIETQEKKMKTVFAAFAAILIAFGVVTTAAPAFAGNVFPYSVNSGGGGSAG